jgi:hypothetical protein
MTSSAGKPAAAGYPRDSGDGRSVSKATTPRALAERLQRDLDQQLIARGDSILLVPSKQGAALPAPTSTSYTELPYEDDEPLTMPSAFRATPVKQSSWFVHQLKAGLLGMTLGFALVLPTVLWLTGRLGDPTALSRSTVMQTPVVEQKTEPAPEQKTEVVAVRPVETVSRAAAGADQVAVIQQPVAGPDPEKRRREEVEGLLERAREMIGDGNMLRAREILGDALLADNPHGAFALAETYDPNILAATGARDVRAEVERARTLYVKALAGGVTAAENRLNALK